MFPQNISVEELVDSKTYPLDEKTEHSEAANAPALIALSHTPVEHRLYSAMLSVRKESPDTNTFTARSLMTLTGIGSLSTVRRGLEGLLVKRSIDQSGKRVNKRDQARAYSVYSPNEVIARRKDVGGTSLTPYVHHAAGNGDHAFGRAIAHVAENSRLSRREAQVALCCAEGLTNADIGKRLGVTEQTVKFHLRNIFVKFGVKRRAELISRLLA
jgi:DNA-binding CsgD family transcriptional regulator